MSRFEDFLMDVPRLLRKDAVWESGQPIPGLDPVEWRSDIYGSPMRYCDYGQTTSFGWEIDHIDPDGPDDLRNLQPLNWLNNRKKSDRLPSLLEVAMLLKGR